MRSSSSATTRLLTTGLLTHHEVEPNRSDEFESHLCTQALDMHRELGTAAWFSFRFGRSDYGTVAIFPDDASRREHMAHERARDRSGGVDSWLTRPAVDTRVDVIAHKLPSPDVDNGTIAGEITKGLLLTFEPKRDHDEAVRRFLIDAEAMADDEPGTAAWFAIRLESGEYGIFDVFPANGARLRHLTGHVPRQLAKEAFSLLGGMPEMHLLDVVATTLTPQYSHT